MLNNIKYIVARFIIIIYKKTDFNTFIKIIILKRNSKKLLTKEYIVNIINNVNNINYVNYIRSDYMKTAIVFSSKYGTTQKCAEFINEELNEKAEIINLDKQECQHLGNYEVILIGGSVYAGKVKEEVRKFVEDNKEILSNKKVGFFLCCKEGGDKIEEYMNTNFPNSIVQKAFVKEHLGHEINLERMNFLEKVLLKTVFKVKKSYSNIHHKAIKKVVKKTDKLVDCVDG